MQRPLSTLRGEGHGFRSALATQERGRQIPDLPLPDWTTTESTAVAVKPMGAGATKSVALLAATFLHFAGHSAINESQVKIFRARLHFD